MEDVRECKVALIDREGAIYEMGKVDDGTFHVDYLYEFMKNNYSDDPIFSSLEEEYRRDVFAFHLGNLGYVVFYNSLHEGFKYGMFYFPGDLTKAQRDVIDNLNLGNEKVAICYDLENFGSFVHSNIIGEDGEHSLQDAMEEYSSMKQRNNGHNL